jgi:hypothetical protein
MAQKDAMDSDDRVTSSAPPLLTSFGDAGAGYCVDDYCVIPGAGAVQHGEDTSAG